MDDRTKYIGGSDAAAVLGLSRWRTPLQVWAEKTGNIIPEDISAKLPVRLGNILEETVAKFFTEETGKKVRRANETIFHPQHSFLGANLDRRVVGEEAILECKTCSSYKAKEWDGEEMPQEYILQVLHYLAVTGAKEGYLAVLIGNHDFKWKKIKRDEQVIADLVKREVDFWTRFIVPRLMPHIITANDGETLYRLFSTPVEGSVVALGDEADRLIEQIEAMNSDALSLKNQISRHRNELKALLQENEVGETAKHLISWKAQVRRAFDIDSFREADFETYERFTKKTTSRVLRFRTKKEE